MKARHIPLPTAPAMRTGPYAYCGREMFVRDARAARAAYRRQTEGD